MSKTAETPRKWNAELERLLANYSRGHADPKRNLTPEAQAIFALFDELERALQASEAALAGDAIRINELETDLTNCMSLLAEARKALDRAEAEIAAYKEREKMLVGLVDVAKCPNCDGWGWTVIQVGQGQCEQEQCQWCYEQNTARTYLADAALAAQGGQP